MHLSVICDYLEEDWPSMDLVADMLLDQAARLPGVSVRRVRPTRKFRVPGHRDTWSLLDRLFGRFVEYPVALALSDRRASVFHIADHSYAHLGMLLPRARTGVFCHDADAFRAAIDSRQSGPRRTLARVLLDATRRAAIIFHSTEAVRAELVGTFGFPPSRLVAAPYGVPMEFTPTALPTDPSVQPPGGYLLHVGSLIPRKNPEFLLRLFANCRRRFPTVELVQVGGTWPERLEKLLDELELRQSVRQLRGIDRHHLASLYRGAFAVLVPSTAEGFGLPLTEALSCGALVLASDLPVLREVAGDAALHLPVSDLSAWSQVLDQILGGASVGPTLETRLARASLYSWDRHARTIVSAYRQLL